MTAQAALLRASSKSFMLRQTGSRHCHRAIVGLPLLTLGYEIITAGKAGAFSKLPSFMRASNDSSGNGPFYETGRAPEVIEPFGDVAHSRCRGHEQISHKNHNFAYRIERYETRLTEQGWVW